MTRSTSDLVAWLTVCVRAERLAGQDLVRSRCVCVGGMGEVAYRIGPQGRLESMSDPADFPLELVDLHDTQRACLECCVDAMTSEAVPPGRGRLPARAVPIGVSWSHVGLGAPESVH